MSEYASNRIGTERTEAQILWQRRIVLSITPLIFSLLGCALILRFNRKGRGFGVAIALACLIVYYLLAFLGEQLARTDRISVLEGSLIPIGLSLVAILWFNFSGRLSIMNSIRDRVHEFVSGIDFGFVKRRRANVLVDFTTGIRDFDLVLSILKYYFLTLTFLAAVFVIFTAFELWKFAGTIDGGIILLLKYLFYLTPFIYIQLAPSAAMIATLATYVIKSRQNEIITWTSAGQSVYRLLLPCLLLMIVFGLINWQVQERLAPAANQRQDALRSEIRSRGNTVKKAGRFWVANDKRIYAFELESEPGSDKRSGSDNETGSGRDCSSLCAVRNLTIFEFDFTGGRLQTLYRAESAVWQGTTIRFTSPLEKTTLGDSGVVTARVESGELLEEANPFAELRKKPSHLTIDETKQQLRSSEAEVERRNFAIAIEKKHTTLVLPFVIALFTAPFALSLSRKGKVITVGYAVGLWLLFMGITSSFEQLGLSGSLPAYLAVWGPLALFAMLGIYLMSRVKT